MKKKVYLLGDSISIQYGPYLERIIKDDFFYNRKTGREEKIIYSNIPKGENGGDSNQIICFLKEMFFSGKRYEILLINCGLHDVKRERVSKRINITLEEYRENLREIVELSKKVSGKMIWIQTTMVNEKLHNNRGFGPYRYNEDIGEFNRAARDVMYEMGIKVIEIMEECDFYVTNYRDHMHFVDDIRILQAERIAEMLYDMNDSNDGNNRKVV